MKFIRIILFPLVPFYYIVTWLRNIFYDKGWLKSKPYNLPVICVGNLSTGGTGKTPMIEYLVRLLKKEYKVATLSRGYKRKTDGFVVADAEADASSIGDEPYQFYRKFPEIIVAVDADRQNGITQLLTYKDRPDVILLDDAFQHRRVKAGFNILLTSYQKPYTKDFVLPTGNLREPRSGANRADVIIVTKCPIGLEEDEKRRMLSQLSLKAGQDVFFSQINYSEKLKSSKIGLELDDLPKFTLVTGIANPQPLVEYLTDKGLRFEHIEYRDHHEFKPHDIKMLSEKKLIVTTEKDYVRLSAANELKGKLFYLPIRFKIDRPIEFEALVHSYLAKET
ncbi:tetraacyldisaccharide 4'-kinase [Winogradskyella sp. DF17]|jgi:tetraacyldisaccharide 4'-kinase|uniref:Tetraacyldisaccharide 4'-kinase n=1 Tax=Winogradskyella pelagia TaxID=2819984 RepID=A0ABS3SZD4_9FLAO|nr:tetraacyldisaccharide 4'-kinase [Winogradskyella sp. DF17]MBO3115858.1 tetraacyldisaccharide 4'-kinase [Winogradskyella sp. DF17]